MSTNVVDAIEGRLKTLCINDDTIWEGLTTAPTAIAIFGQLMISTIGEPDMQIDKIDKTHIPLIKQPESFRKTLVQIANQVDGAFTKAHSNMEVIQTQMAQVPGYVNDCLQLIKRGNYGVINQNLPRRLENIKEIADNGLRMSAQVCDAFERLEKLHQQVVLAIAASQGAKEQEIRAAIKAKNDQEMKSRLRANNREQENVQHRLEIARKNVRQCQQRLYEANQIGIGDIFGIFIASLPLILRVKSAENAVIEAKLHLYFVELDAKRVEKQREKICDEFAKSLENMQINVAKEISRDAIINLLKAGMGKLSQFYANYAQLIKNFHSINSHIQQVTHRALCDFVDDAEEAQASPFLIDFMADSIEKSLELSYATHRAAKMYVQFSNQNIVKSLNDMHHCKNRLLAFQKFQLIFEELFS